MYKISKNNYTLRNQRGKNSPRMTILCTFDVGVPMPDNPTSLAFRDRVEAACNTARILEEQGIGISPDDNDMDIAAKLSLAYAENEAVTEAKCTDDKMSPITPGTFMLVEDIIKTYSMSVVKSSQEIRIFVTNKLLLETESNDSKIRLKALELLGKISDVGLFSDKTEVVIKHEDAEDLQKQIKSKLFKILGHGYTVDAEFEEVEKELGSIKHEDLDLDSDE